MTTTQELLHIPYEDLVPSEDNIRYKLNGDLEGLMTSIAGADPKAPTLHQPLTVSPEDGKWRIIAGHRRHAAIGIGRAQKRIDLKWAVPCFVKEYDDTDRRIAMVVENTQREGLDPLDEAVAYAQLKNEFGLTQKQIAEKVGFSQAYVSGRIKAGRLVPAVVQAIRDGDVEFQHALPLADLDNADQQRFIEAWVGEEIPALKIVQFVQKVKGEKVLDKAAREAIRAGYTVFYQGSPNSLEEYIPEGKEAETHHIEAVSDLDKLNEGIEFLMLKANFMGEVSYYPIHFVDATDADAEGTDPQAAQRSARRENNKRQMGVITDLAGTRPGMGRVDGMLARMVIRSLNPAAATTVCAMLGVEVKDVDGWNNAVESLIDEAGTDKRALATIGVISGLVMNHADRDDYLMELVEGYEPMQLEPEEDPF
jgi:ParB/RepB/Spo0J family partition protein